MIKSLVKHTIHFLLLLLLIITFSQCSQSPDERISSHLKYSGYTEPEYKSFTKKSRYIKMKDGTKVAIDIFLPAEGPENRKHPSIFIFTPYGRSYLIPDLPWYKRIGARLTRGTWGPVFDYSTRKDVKLYLSHGYAFIVADMRGAGASFGTQVPFSLEIVDDGIEVINWIADQPWSNGNVGMMERSYLGWIQLMMAARAPEPLKCIMPETILSDAYTEGIRPGGIDAIGWIRRYSKLLNDLNRNRLDRENMSLPTTPVIDEDGDGDIADEIPIMTKGDTATFLDDGNPAYIDGNKRKNIYYNATKEHTGNLLFSFVERKNTPYLDSTEKNKAKSVTFPTSSPGYHIPEIIKSNIPVYHIGGWFDGFIKGTTRLYATMAGKTATRLHIAPRFHYPPYINSDYQNLFGYDDDYKEQLIIERLRFFDRYLKGVKNGIDEEPPVNIYVMNSGWRSEFEWPLKRRKATNFYLNNKNMLTERKGLSGSDEYKVDFTHSSSYGSNMANRLLMMYVPDSLMIRTEADTKCLTYETDPLSEDMEVTGHPVINLWISSNRKEGDIYVYITDVDTEGRSLYVTEGQLRAGWKDLYDDNDQVLGRVNIQPDLPWQGYKKDQYVHSVFKKGVPIKLSFDLYPTSWLFRKGHRLRISIAGADHKNFEMNPVLCSTNEPETCKDTSITVHRSKQHSSFISLPLIPAGNKENR